MKQKNIWLLITVAALGYFVDIYDLILFNVVKKESLLSLGLLEAEIKNYEISLFNYQMFGMLLGGVGWGVLGDKKGRVSVLFGSILMYSIVNICNAFVTDVFWYKVCRIIAGVGLAGELGAGITLVSETMSKEKRGYGTMIIVTFGALGAVVAALVGNKGAWFNQLFNTTFQNWQIAYLVGGFMGISLLVLRAGAFESSFFHAAAADSTIQKGNFLAIFKNTQTTKKYISCILIGIPIWYIIGVLISLSDRFSQALGGFKVSVSNCVMYAYLGLSVGDLLCGLLSQVLRSRKRVIYLYLVISCGSILVYLFNTQVSETYFYWMAFVLGASTGYWALFVTNASEQFGTNIRSTVTNTVPNFVRGSVILISSSFKFLSNNEIGEKTIYAGLIVGAVCMALAFVGTYSIDETFGKDLNYTE